METQLQVQPPFVLFDDASLNGVAPKNTNGVRLFENPHQVLSCSRAEDVPQTLAAIDAAIANGHYVAGYMAYELGYVLEPKLTPLLANDQDTPLIWMGVFDAPRVLSHDDAEKLFTAWGQDDCTVSDPTADIDRDNYINHVERVREHIRAGDVYQINYTFKERFTLSGNPLALYARLRHKQRARWGAVIATGDETILSVSPELFFEREGSTARTRPMKGTAPRAANPEADVARAYWLRHDEKSRSENLMIVDLLRNDLGRIAEVGTVKVTDLFQVETYPTLHQLTSTIEAELRSDTAFSAWVHALFPCGSITGAPKVKAMEIIADLEDAPRGVYTGAVGYCAKDVSQFNVAIRTLTCDQDGNGEIGIGSGIVYDSDPAQEWNECHLKARFLTDQATTFGLLETLKWEPGSGFALLDRHLNRLDASALYFGYPLDQDVVRQALGTAVHDKTQAQRVRLVIDARGEIDIEMQDLSPLSELTFTFCDAPNDPNSPFTYHKTTNRTAYDDARVQSQADADEVVFVNPRGEVTEGSYTNVFVERRGQFLTPPLTCGLLPGTLRQELLDNKRAVEAILTPGDLGPDDRVWLGNSVRGLVSARCV